LIDPNALLLVTFHPGLLFAKFSSIATGQALKWQLSRWVVAFLQTAPTSKQVIKFTLLFLSWGKSWSMYWLLF
jgi:hypothetical protein